MKVTNDSAARTLANEAERKYLHSLGQGSAWTAYVETMRAAYRLARHTGETAILLDILDWASSLDEEAGDHEMTMFVSDGTVRSLEMDTREAILYRAIRWSHAIDVDEDARGYLSRSDLAAMPVGMVVSSGDDVYRRYTDGWHALNAAADRFDDDSLAALIEELRA